METGVARRIIAALILSLFVAGYRTYNTGRSESHASPIPGDAMLTGSPTAGHVEVDNECPLYDNNQSSVETLTLIDAAGLTSNSLSTTMQRPPGAP